MMIEVRIPHIILKVKFRGQPFVVESLIAALEWLQSLREPIAVTDWNAWKAHVTELPQGQLWVWISILGSKCDRQGGFNL